MAPMFIALLVVWTSAKDVPDVVFDVYGGSVLIYVTFLSLRIAAVGGVLQWLFLPMIRDQALENFLSKIKCNKTLILAVTSAVVLLHDFKRRSQIVMEARMARGLVGRTRLSKWKSFLSTISPVVYTSILSGINRSDLWTHRGIDVVEYRAANSRNNQNLKITEFLLIFWFLLLVTLIWFIN